MLGRLPATHSLMVSLVSKEPYNLLSVKIFKNLNTHRTLKSSRCLRFIFNNSSEYRYPNWRTLFLLDTSARYFDPRPESGAALGTDHTFTQRIYVSTYLLSTQWLDTQLSTNIQWHLIMATMVEWVDTLFCKWSDHVILFLIQGSPRPCRQRWRIPHGWRWRCLDGGTHFGWVENGF